MSDKYILDGKTPVPADLMTWAKWFETADRRVDATTIGRYRVSTVFLGLDHQYGEGPPLIFETMVFADGGSDECWCDRCSTWDEAEAMHQRGCEYAHSLQVN